MRIDDLDSPAVLIDLDVMQHNLRRFQDHCDAAGLRNRPHIKTHKIPELARLQVSLGAHGITCQKLGEAEIMADAGIDDILITYNLVGGSKPQRAANLARRVKLTVCCDNDVVAEGLSAAFTRAGLSLDVLVECDTGAGRCGVATPQAAVDLAERLDRLPGLRFAGLMTYPPAGRLPEVRAFLAAAVDSCRQHGLEARIVSNGGTPDAWRASTEGGVTEHRAGTYIYNDRMMMKAGAATLADCAMTVLATVVSRPAEDRAILDTGSKTLAADTLGPEDGHGLILSYPDARIVRLNEEHGIVDLSRCTAKPAVGERVRIVPNHTCVVSNLHDHVFAVHGEEVVEEWTVAARGCSR